MARDTIGLEERGAHPGLYTILFLPFGMTSGYVTVTLGYLLAQAHISTVQIAGMVAISLLPHTWKVLWAPIVDTTLTRKRWYALAAILTAAGMFASGFLPLTEAWFPLLTALVFGFNLAVTFLGMSLESLIAFAAAEKHKGRVAGWLQAGNLGGAGLGGGAGLWLAQHVAVPWLGGAVLGSLCLAACAALPFVDEPPAERAPRYLDSLKGVAADVWNVAISRGGVLAMMVLFFPIGVGAAQNLWPAVAGDWHASAETVALVNGALNGVVSILGCLAGGYLCDWIDRKGGYLAFGFILALIAIAMAEAPRTETMFVVFTMLYNFCVGLTYAGFSAVTLEAIGRGAGATKYNLFACLSNVPIAYMTYLDGWAGTHWGSGAMLLTEAFIGIAFIGVFAVITFATRSRAAAIA